MNNEVNNFSKSLANNQPTNPTKNSSLIFIVIGTVVVLAVAGFIIFKFFLSNQAICARSINNTYGLYSEETTAHFRAGNLSSVNAKFAIKINSEYLEQKDLIKEMLASNLKDFSDKFGVTPDVSETADSIILELKISGTDYKEKMYIDDTESYTKENFVKDFQEDGYTCR